MALPFKYYILNEQEIESGALDLRYYTKTQADGKYVLKETGKQLIESAMLTDLTDGGNTTLHKHDDKADKIYATNLVTNGDFSNGITGWGLNGSTISATNNTLSIIGNGAVLSVGTMTLSSLAYASGKKIYSRGRVRVTNSDSNRLSIILYDGSNYYVGAQQTTIANGTWYDISGVITLLAGGSKLEVSPQHRYVDAATSNGKVMEVQYVLAIDLTAIFGAGKEPTKDQIDRLLSIYPNSWFNGTAEITNIKQVFNEKADRLFATNLVVNGDFNNGTTGWAGVDAIVNGVAEATATGQYFGIYQNIPNHSNYANHKIYASALLKSSTSNVQVAVSDGISNTASISLGDNLFKRYSLVKTMASNLTTFVVKIYDLRTSGWDKYYVDDFLALDLTQIFGAGKEPTKEQMDWLLAQKFTNSWFNGTAELTSILDLLTLVNTKANITQEAWITPTLLNGWVNNSGGFTSRYKKDSMGVVWVELFVNSGTTGSIILQLPIGYRPTQFTFITGNATGIASGIVVGSNGDITHSFGTNTNNHRYVFAFRTN